MIYIQAGICFLIGIGYGVLQTRRSMAVRRWTMSIPRAKRGLLAAAIMLGSMAIFFLVLTLALRNHGFGNNGMTPFVWLVVGLFGLLFIHGQTMATALLVASAFETVTANRAQTSSNHIIQENDQHEAPSS